MKVSVVVPTYNEREIIRRLIKSILKIAPNVAEVIVVDDNSPDGTWKIVKKMIEKNKSIKLLRRINKKGLASAIFDGVSMAKGDIVVWMDADFSHPPKLLPKLIRELNVYDISIASRYAKGGKDSREFFRVLTSKLINLQAQILLSSKIKDYTTGFVAVNRYVFDKIQFIPKGYGEYCIEFLYLSIKRGFKIKEIPYTNIKRMTGKTKALSDISNYLRHILAYSSIIFKLRMK